MLVNFYTAKTSSKTRSRTRSRRRVANITAPLTMDMNCSAFSKRMWSIRTRSTMHKNSFFSFAVS